MRERSLDEMTLAVVPKVTIRPAEEPVTSLELSRIGQIHVQVAVPIEVHELEAGNGLVRRRRHAEIAGNENPVFIEVDRRRFTAAVARHDVGIAITVQVREPAAAGRVTRSSETALWSRR